MSWFGFGGSKKPEENTSSSSSSFSSDDHVFDSGSRSSDFVAPSSDFSSAGAGMGSAGSIEQELMMEQQKAMIQAVIFKLTDLSFDQCVTKPSTSLSNNEQSCISAVVGKYIDTTELVMARFQGSQQ